MFERPPVTPPAQPEYGRKPPPIPPEALRTKTGRRPPPPIPREALRPKRGGLVEQKETVSLRIGAATEASPAHPDRNEDAFYYSVECATAFVGDGMGGVPAGEFASGVAASLVRKTELLRQIDKAQGTELDRLQQIYSVFGAHRDKPLDQDAVEKATTELLKLMNEKIETVVHTNKEVFQRAKIFFKDKIGQEYDPDNESHATQLRLIISTIGTTGTLTKIWKNADGQSYVTAGNVGDSRAYILRKGELIPLTHDHSQLQILLDAGVKDENGLPIDGSDITKTIAKSDILELADTQPALQDLALRAIRMKGDRVPVADVRNLIYLALGGGTAAKKLFQADFTPSIKTVLLQPGDRVISASDGLLDNSDNDKIATTATKYPDTPSECAKALQKEATAISVSNDIRAKKDDVTVIVQAFNS